jgi:hypothetical protein
LAEKITVDKTVDEKNGVLVEFDKDISIFVTVEKI